MPRPVAKLPRTLEPICDDPFVEHLGDGVGSRAKAVVLPVYALSRRTYAGPAGVVDAVRAHHNDR
jgi:hypothetical protein